MIELWLTQQLQKEIDLFCQNYSRPTNSQPGLSLSIKTTWHNFLNQEEPLLLFTQADWSTGTLPNASQWAAYRLNQIKELIFLDGLMSDSVCDALSCCSLSGAVAQPSPNVLLHAAASGKYTSFSQPLPLLSVLCGSDGEVNLKTWLENRAQIYPFLSNIPALSKLISLRAEEQNGMILMNRGLLVTSDNIERCVKIQEQIVDIIETHLFQYDIAKIPYKFFVDPWEVLPNLRSFFSTKAGYPIILHLDQSERTACLMQDLHELNSDLQTVLLPDFVARCGFPCNLEGESEPEIQTNLICPSWKKFQPSYMIYPGLGIVAVGQTAPEAYQTAQVAITNASAVQIPSRFEKCSSLSEIEIQESLQWQIVPDPSRQTFSGEIALVTGAASGIGRACAASLLARGAVVVGLDINSNIEQTFNNSCYLGLKCDITNEAEIRSSLRETVKRFGGLDILILNAGLFPSGCKIQSIDLNEFTRVMNVNLNANLVLLREAYPLLKKAPGYGRVVIIGSKNMKAPGPGAVAYSTSKAALTQMARVAALEWGPDGIRVNVIHPDAVFDTALYTPEVLKARAEYYGLTIDQYKKRNLLKTEITSHDVAEMVAEMCGPIFRSVTGSQIQMDGGNERTI